MRHNAEKIQFRRYMFGGVSIFITTDASIYGFGAWLSIDNNQVACLSDEISSVDAKMLGHGSGDNTGQQCVEAMCLLIARRAWSHLWREKRYVFIIRLRPDNNGALSVYSTLAGSSPGMNAVAHGYALDC